MQNVIATYPNSLITRLIGIVFMGLAFLFSGYVDQSNQQLPQKESTELVKNKKSRALQITYSKAKGLSFTWSKIIALVSPLNPLFNTLCKPMKIVFDQQQERQLNIAISILRLPNKTFPKSSKSDLPALL